MTHLLQALTCLVCGLETADRRVVAWAMARYREPVEGRLFASIPRCLDAAACRVRTEAQGEAWPLDDATPAPAREASPVLASSRDEEASRWG